VDGSQTIFDLVVPSGCATLGPVDQKRWAATIDRPIRDGSIGIECGRAEVFFEGTGWGEVYEDPDKGAEAFLADSAFMRALTTRAEETTRESITDRTADDGAQWSMRTSVKHLRQAAYLPVSTDVVTTKATVPQARTHVRLAYQPDALPIPVHALILRGRLAPGSSGTVLITARVFATRGVRFPPRDVASGTLKLDLPPNTTITDTTTRRHHSGSSDRPSGWLAHWWDLCSPPPGAARPADRTQAPRVPPPERQVSLQDDRPGESRGWLRILGVLGVGAAGIAILAYAMRRRRRVRRRMTRRVTREGPPS